MKIPRAIRRRNRRMFRLGEERRKTDFSVCSREERVMIYTYLLNLIKAGHEKRFTEEVFNFCIDVIGQKNAYSLMKPLYSTKLDYDDSDDLFAWTGKNIPDRDTLRVIQDVFVPKIASLLQDKSGRRNKELLLRLDAVQEIFKLSDEEVSILELYYLLSTHSTISNYLGQDPLDLTNFHLLKVYGHTVLGMNRRVFRSVLSNTILFDAGIVDHDGALDRRICDYLLGVGERELRNTFFSRDMKTPLTIKDFSLAGEEVKVMEALLKSRGGCNILFYGAPGTGKTSLVKALAKHLKMDLFSVRVSEESNNDDEDDMAFRLKALYATINATKRRESLILIDEADELLNAAVMPHIENSTNKSWINNLLDSHGRNIIWITNRRWGIDSSTMRRFAFSLEFEQLTTKNRLTVLKHALKTQGLKSYMVDKDLQELCKTYKVDAGGIVNAVRLLKIKKNARKESVIKMVEAMLKNHEKATACKACGNSRKRKKDFSTYSLNGLNTSHNLEEISHLLKEFADAHEKDPGKCVSLLLYGPPGTGKSEFVHFLGSTLGKDVNLKRVSDIHDMFVGQTEKNIAQAFHEAKDDKSILFFDEADSFFFPRKEAVRSWEKSFTNEILAQLDDYAGIVVFATNDIDGLDHAALRRFRFKVRFSFLEPDGVLHFYNIMLAPLAGGVQLLSPEVKQLQAIRRLAPGDFIVVRDQHTFVQQAKPTHQDLISGLEHEVLHKKLDKQVGF